MSSIADRLAEKGLGLALEGAQAGLNKILPKKADRVVDAIFDVAKEVIGDSDPDTIEEALENNPHLLADIKLKILQVAADEHAAELQAEVDRMRIASADRDSARNRHIKMRDPVPAILGCSVVAGFFAVLFVMVFMDIPDGSMTILNIMVGSLGTMTAAVMNYYFGSSSDSKIQQKQLQEMRLGGGVINKGEG